MEKAKQAIEKFNQENPGYKMELDTIESYESYIVVYLTEPVLGLSDRMVFDSEADLTDWCNGVVLD